MTPTIDPGSRWLHKNGDTYLVLHIANEDIAPENRTEYPLMVVYQSSAGVVFAKSPELFLRSRTKIEPCLAHDWDIDRECCTKCGAHAWTPARRA